MKGTRKECVSPEGATGSVESNQSETSRFLSGNTAKVTFHTVLCNRIKLKYSLLCLLLLPTPCILSLPVQLLPCILACPACREWSAHLLATTRAQDRDYSGNCIGNLICILTFSFLRWLKYLLYQVDLAVGYKLLDRNKTSDALGWRSFIWKLGKEFNGFFRYINGVKASNWNKIIYCNCLVNVIWVLQTALP